MPFISRPQRIYVDSSVFGGCFDPEFCESSNRFFDMVQQGRFHVVLTEIVLGEVELAPECVRNVLSSLPEYILERVDIDSDIIELRDAYLAAKIVGDRWKDDATHVAAATVARVDAIVS